MNIGIDARFIGPEGTGIGMYTLKLIDNLQKIDIKNNYSIFLRRKNWQNINFGNNNFRKVLADVSWYSVEEQLKMPNIINKENLDLLHVPHFNVPILYKGKFIVTIHDLIHHKFSQESATTKNPLIFKLKRLGYKKIIGHAVNHSSKIITPSKYVKSEIVKHFNVAKTKISVTYEAAEEEYFTSNKQKSTRKKQDLIYVGNAYPHKNLENLLKAISSLKNVNLLIVCPRDVFIKRLEKIITENNLNNRVKLSGYLDSIKLREMFSQSKAYIFPSLSEGFGIPGLNAMAAMLPVIAADIPTFRAVYRDAAYYFNPNDAKDMALKIQKVLYSEKIRSNLINKGNKLVKEYSWQKMAKETLIIYKNISYF